jgi:hypothetical protein
MTPSLIKGDRSWKQKEKKEKRPPTCFVRIKKVNEERRAPFRAVVELPGCFDKLCAEKIKFLFFFSFLLLRCNAFLSFLKQFLTSPRHKSISTRKIIELFSNVRGQRGPYHYLFFYWTMHFFFSSELSVRFCCARE